MQAVFGNGDGYGMRIRRSLCHEHLCLFARGGFTASNDDGFKGLTVDIYWSTMHTPVQVYE